MPSWKKMSNVLVAPRPSKPGVWRRKEGGFLVRGRAKDPFTGKLKQAKFSVTDTDDPTVAYERLQAALREIRDGVTDPVPQSAAPTMQFAEFAVSLMEERVKDGKIASASTRMKLASVLATHLIPAFGEMRMDTIRHLDIARWRSQVADRIHADDYAPTTANSWLAELRVIFKAATLRFELDRNPMDGIENFDTRLHHTYTEEEPNSLIAVEVPPYLAKMRELFPERFAMVALGFATGWRPSTMRPLRRRGPHADILWDRARSWCAVHTPN